MAVTVASHSLRAADISLSATVIACPCRTNSAFSSRNSCNSCLVTFQPFTAWLYCDCSDSYSFSDTQEEKNVDDNATIRVAKVVRRGCFISNNLLLVTHTIKK